MGRTLIYKNWSVVCNDGSMWHCFRSVSNKVGWEHIKPFEQKVYSEEGELLFPVQATSGYQIYVVLETQIWTQPGHQGQPRSSLELSEMKKIVETDHVLRKTYFSHSYFRYYEDSEGNLCTADGIIQVLQGKKCRHVSFNTKLTVHQLYFSQCSHRYLVPDRYRPRPQLSFSCPKLRLRLFPI